MGGIIKSENPALCLNNDIIDNGSATNTKQVRETVDCPVLRSVITLHFNSNVYIMYVSEEWSGNHCTDPPRTSGERRLFSKQFQAGAIFSHNQKIPTACRCIEWRTKFLEYLWLIFVAAEKALYKIQFVGFNSFRCQNYNKSWKQPFSAFNLEVKSSPHRINIRPWAYWASSTEDWKESPWVGSTLSAVNHSLDKDRAPSFASLPLHDVELLPAEKAKVERRRDVSLVKAKGLEWVNLHWRH